MALWELHGFRVMDFWGCFVGFSSVLGGLGWKFELFLLRRCKANSGCRDGNNFSPCPVMGFTFLVIIVYEMVNYY